MKQSLSLCRLVLPPFLLLLLPWTPSVDAAIPSSRTILSRTGRNGGRGIYVVEQEVRFLNAAEGSNLLKERWLVHNADTMRLIVSSASSSKPGEFRWDALYRDGKRLASVPDMASTETKATVASSEFLEPYLYIRTPTRFYDSLIRNKILPPTAARPAPRIANINTYKPSAEPAVRLGREGGVISWVFGEPTPVGSTVQFPGAWFEQDAFLLRKIRLPQQTEMVMTAHAPAGGGLKLARERTITWTTHDKSAGPVASATVKVLSVKALPEGSLAAQFLAQSLTPAESKAAHLPNDPVVKEFYARFR